MEAIQKAAPGWYRCPVDPDILRFFNGSAWTEATRLPADAPSQPGWQVPMAQVSGLAPVRTTSVPTFAAQGYQPYDAVGEASGPTSALHWIVPVGRSGASIAAGYVGLVALAIWPVGPLAIGLGIWGLRKARAGGHGSGRSVFAIVAGTLGTMLGVFFLVGSLL